MTELVGLIWLGTGLLGLVGTAYLLACCMRIASAIEFVVAVYVLSWTWIVGIAFLLSPAGLVTRGWLTGAIGCGFVGAFAAWHLCGRPQPPTFRHMSPSVRSALHEPAVAALAVAVALGVAYTLALALFTPANEGDALAYHLVRAASWKQEHMLGYVENAVDLRLNVNPPNAEIGQLATMLLSGNDRYVALPQLAAYGVLVLAVVGLARRVGFGTTEAIFGGLVFATLPVVVVQASGALNDLVVASFLAAAALFALRPGSLSLLFVAFTVGLALGTKFTAALALPALIVVAALGRPRQPWLSLAAAGFAGIALGSGWYLLNLAETGELDGGLAEAADQRVELSLPAITTEAMRLTLDLVDMSGAPRPHSTLYFASAGVIALLGLWTARRSIGQGMGFAAASIVVACIYFVPRLVAEGQDLVIRAWSALGHPDTAPFEAAWDLNEEADPVLSWYGPLGALLLCLGTVAVVVLWRREKLPRVVLGFVLAPWMLLLTLSLTVVWDPFRGRFLVFGVALAAATWGALARWPAVAGAVAAVGVTSLALALANYQGRPSGLADVWPRDEPPVVSVSSIWAASRPEAQARLRPQEGEEIVYDYFAKTVPDDAAVAVVARENEYLSPYFGSRLSRNVALVSEGDAAPEPAEWLVIPPASNARRCRIAWTRELALESGWRIERRIGPDTCLEDR